MTITWKNVSSQASKGVAELIKTSADLSQRGFEGLQDTFETVKQNQGTRLQRILDTELGNYKQSQLDAEQGFRDRLLTFESMPGVKDYDVNTGRISYEKDPEKIIPSSTFQGSDEEYQSAVADTLTQAAAAGIEFQQQGTGVDNRADQTAHIRSLFKQAGKGFDETEAGIKGFDVGLNAGRSSTPLDAAELDFAKAAHDSQITTLNASIASRKEQESQRWKDFDAREQKTINQDVKSMAAKWVPEDDVGSWDAQAAEEDVNALARTLVDERYQPAEGEKSYFPEGKLPNVVIDRALERLEKGNSLFRLGYANNDDRDQLKAALKESADEYILRQQSKVNETAASIDDANQLKLLTQQRTQDLLNIKNLQKDRNNIINFDALP